MYRFPFAVCTISRLPRVLFVFYRFNLFVVLSSDEESLVKSGSEGIGLSGLMRILNEL